MLAAIVAWIARYWQWLIGGLLACLLGSVQLRLYLHQTKESSLRIQELETRLRDQSKTVSSPGASDGIEVRPTFLGFSYRALILDSRELIVVLNDGRSWIDTNRELLRERLAMRGRVTRFCLIDPASPYIDILIRKNGKKKETEIDEIRRSCSVIAEIAPRWADVEVRAHARPSPYGLFLTEDLAIVHPYFFFEAGSLPMFTFRRGTELYEAYREDAHRLLKEATPLTLGAP